MTTPLDTVLSRLERVKEHGGHYQALCPGHEDREASLSVTEGDDGRVVLHCHAGCDPAAIVERMGLKLSDLFPPRQAGESARVDGRARIEAVYDYVDEHGAARFQVVRYSPKAFKQRVPNGNGSYNWSLKGVTRVLYRLPVVTQRAAEGKVILLAEGEKDVHALESIGVPATTNAGGAGKWQVSYSKSLTGAQVVIVPDNDEAGREHAEKVAQALQGYGKSVRVLELPGLPPKGDVSDWVAAGGTREQLIELVRACPEWEPKPLAERSGPGSASIPLTDLGNAERLIAAHGGNLRFEVDSGKWLVWNGKRWEPDSESQVKRLAAKVIRDMTALLKDLDGRARDELYAHIKKSESKPRLDAMVRAAAENIDRVPIRAADLDREPMFLNCLNGTVDLRSGERRPHAREDLITKLAPVEYDPNAKAPRWLQFLAEVFQGDAEIIAFAKRMAGYCLTGSTREECVFMLTGKGQNGKSKFVETLRAVLGDYAANTPFSTFLEERDSNTADLASLMGRRLVTASEAPSGGYRGREEGTSFNESVLKQCTGGDPVTCRHLYREYFTYIPTYKILFSTNEVPRIRSQNYAMKRRLMLIPFRQRFYDLQEGKTPVKDDRLLEKLLAEKSGILAWAVQGCLEWQRDGLATPAAIRAEVDRLFESQDPLGEFLETECEVTPGGEVEVGVLWQRYLLWCDETGRKSAFKQPHFFSRSLNQRDGIESRRGTGGVRLLAGIGLAGDYSSWPGNQPEDGAGSPSDSDASDAKSDFPETSFMRDSQGDFSENTDSASLSVTPERETESSGGSVDVESAAETDPVFESEEDFDSFAATVPDPPAEDADPGGPGFICGQCKAAVTLRQKNPGVYYYACGACGHEGILPEYEYQLWLDRQAILNRGAA